MKKSMTIQLNKHSKFLKQSVSVFLVVLLMSLSTANDSYGLDLYEEVPNFIGAGYGMPYDTSRQGLAEGGKSCVNFESTKISSEGAPKVKTIAETVESYSDFSDKMGLSIMAQLKGLAGGGTMESSASLKILNSTEINSFSKTALYHNSFTSPTMWLKKESIALKPEYKAMVSSGIVGLDKFRAKCGDSFIIGIQKGAYYFGTTFISKHVKTTNKKLSASFKFKYTTGGTSFQTGMNHLKNTISSTKKEKKRFVSETSLASLAGPTSEEDIIKQFKEFKAPKNSGNVVSLVIAPYSVVRDGGALEPEGILSKDYNEEALKTLLNALWDLKGLMDESEYILKRPMDFALGVPMDRQNLTGLVRDAGMNRVRRMRERWQITFDRLYADTKECLKKVDGACVKLANWYKSNPISIKTEGRFLPKKYSSQCYGDFTVTAPLLVGEAAGGHEVYHRTKGDDEMGGGPVLTTIDLMVQRDGRRLLMNYSPFTLKEDKQCSTCGEDVHTTFKSSVPLPPAILFNLDPDVPGLNDVFKECEYATHPIGAADGSGPMLPKEKGTNIYGWIADRSERNPAIENVPGKGLIHGVECRLDHGDDDDDGQLWCRNPNLNSFNVLLANRLDLQADTADPNFNAVARVSNFSSSEAEAKFKKSQVEMKSAEAPPTGAQFNAKFQIVSGAGKCLDVHRPDQAKNGTRLQVWDCGDAENQLWQVVGKQIRSSAGKCLDVHRPDQASNGARVQIWDCGVDAKNQTWQVVGDRIISGAGKCLDVHRPDQANNGAVVHIWKCGENAQNQTWRLVER